jgi:Uma2 family endonuclease
MSGLAHSRVTWADFLRLPERPAAGKRYELHDGEVVVAPPARLLHIKLQKRIERLLEALAGERVIPGAILGDGAIPVGQVFAL